MFCFVFLGNMTKVGFSYGLPQHIFYSLLDKYLPGTSFKTVLAKVVVDELTIAPICLIFFIIGMNLAEGNGYQSGWNELKKNFFTIYLVNNQRMLIKTIGFILFQLHVTPTMV